TVRLTLPNSFLDRCSTSARLLLGTFLVAILVIRPSLSKLLRHTNGTRLRLAKVLWYRSVGPREASVYSTAWSTVSFAKENPECFMPIARIHSRFIPFYERRGEHR